MNAQQTSKSRQAEAGTWSRRALTAILLAATLGTGVLVGAAAFGSDGAGSPRGSVSPADPADAPARVSGVDPLKDCFGSPQEQQRWIERGGGDPQQCLIARSTPPYGNAMD